MEQKQSKGRTGTGGPERTEREDTLREFRDMVKEARETEKLLASVIGRLDGIAENLDRIEEKLLPVMETEAADMDPAPVMPTPTASSEATLSGIALPLDFVLKAGRNENDGETEGEAPGVSRAVPDSKETGGGNGSKGRKARKRGSKGRGGRAALSPRNGNRKAPSGGEGGSTRGA